MGVQAEEALELASFDEFVNYLRANTRVFMEVGEKTYYLTHTDEYWRVQDCSELNEKGHFTDCSELVATLNDLLGLACLDGKTIEDAFADAKFYKSIQE